MFKSQTRLNELKMQSCSACSYLNIPLPGEPCHTCINSSGGFVMFELSESAAKEIRSLEMKLGIGVE